MYVFHFILEIQRNKHSYTMNYELLFYDFLHKKIFNYYKVFIKYKYILLLISVLFDFYFLQ